MRSFKWSAMVLLLAAVVSTGVLAQVPDAAWKVRTAAGLPAYETQMHQRNARDRAHIIYNYQQAEVKLPKPQLQEQVAAVRKEIVAADRSLETLKKQHAREPEVVQLIDSIELHHKKAHEHCGLAEELSKKDYDHLALAECCSDMWHELDAAQVETDKLMKVLKLEKLAMPKARVKKPIP